ncbi:Phenol 2-monooxygenase [Mycena indigotica]|uniref:Phenol 2-monooxygenase n=1 Tax=Mycena indigotica TaxID=2126181 RepID=A0A8H6THP4_9AGAR|nr:Phenol 2-monooxygenase [Mycena indigotica]KAF7315925.1 Phenol 2-monooxygenase [Mycena indigotica]
MAEIQPQKVYDVVVVGGGPAGLMAALCLTTYGFNILHIDERPHPTTAGRADGIQPRTIEVLRNIGGVSTAPIPGGPVVGQPPIGGGGLAKRMISQGVRVYEVAFWDPTPTQKLARTSRAPSCPEFIDVVDNYTLLLHQGLIEQAFLEEIEARRTVLPDPQPTPPSGIFRPYNLQDCRTLSESEDPLSRSHPVECTIENGDTKTTYTIRSRYLLGCDGAKSHVRRCIAGGRVGDGEWQGKITMQGEATDIIWGVLDARVKTNFPDIKYKCLIHSRSEGSIMIIPREANLVRFYVQLQTTDNGKIVSIARDKATQDICIARAKKIFEPYDLEFGYVDWFSVYQIGQRIASSYTLDHRIILGGDATHTHSPQAGQGMNISMLDMYTLSWKLNLVMKGLARPEVLLPTYEDERRGVAQELLKFDGAYSRLFSGRGPDAKQLPNGVDPDEFIRMFKQNAFFTSGCGAVYSGNVLNALPGERVAKEGIFNPQGCKLIPGQRLTPGKVVRVVDGNDVRLQQEVKMNGAFRIHVFAGDLAKTRTALERFAAFIDSPGSFFNKYRAAPGTRASIIDAPAGLIDNVGDGKSRHIFNPFFTFLTIVGTHWYQWEIDELPSPLRLYRSQVYGDAVFDKRVPESADQTALGPDSALKQRACAPLHIKYGLDVNKGAIVVVRPDSYVGAVVELSEAGCEGLNDYFAGFLRESGGSPVRASF